MKYKQVPNSPRVISTVKSLVRAALEVKKRNDLPYLQGMADAYLIAAKHVWAMNSTFEPRQ